MNIIVKFVLVSTSLSPVLLIAGVNLFEHNKPWTSWIWLVASSPFLMIVCEMLLVYAAKLLQKHTICIDEFERKDQEMLAFLFIYLLPFIRSGNSTLTTDWLTSICILVIIGFAIAHAGALHFNPVMGFLGYHFYAIKNPFGASNLLITKKDLLNLGKEVQTVQLASNVYLETENVNA